MKLILSGAGRHTRRDKNLSKAKRSVVAATTVLLAASVPAFGFSLPVAADAMLTITGHGWGHGYGAGQYGALGYAVQGQQTYSQILAHYFTGTTIGTVPDQLLRVIITENDGLNITVGSAQPFTAAGHAIPAGYLVNMSIQPGAMWTISQSSTPASCGTVPTWQAVATVPEAQATIVSSAGSQIPAIEAETYAQALQLCLPTGEMTVRGMVQAADYQGSARLINVLSTESYLRGVVASESPASWGTLGTPGPQSQPWGFQELETQAVMARSYALSKLGSYGYADICDSTACQVYEGMHNPSSPLYPLYALADQAVADTANQAVMQGSSVVETQYSSSTGGYTENGAFPGVVDAYDSICIPGACNNNHTWTVQVAESTIQTAYPQIGTLTGISITQRNGLGDFGGRVEQMTIQGTTGSVSTTGQGFAWALGLNSDWFSVAGPIAIQGSSTVGQTPSGSTPLPPPGYWIVSPGGSVYAFGSAVNFGGPSASQLRAPIASLHSTPDGKGYWLTDGLGDIYPYGDAVSYGSTGAMVLNKPIVGMAPTPDGKGYWLVASDGGIFTFGDAQFYGSTGAMVLNKPIVGMAPTPDGKGYWLVASDGGIFSFGDAKFYGSAGSINLNKPIVGMVASADGGGYRLIAADGGVFDYGDAQYYGSLPGLNVTATATSLAPSPDNNGYYVLTSSGKVYSFGDASAQGDLTTMSNPPSSTAGITSVG